MNDTEILAYTDSRITELEKENAELKEKLKGFENGEVVFIGHYEAVKCYPILKERFAELEAQIEKMKCCGNCSKSCFVQDCEDIVNRCDCATSDSLLFKCGEWELAE